jgi:hypothetical protein
MKILLAVVIVAALIGIGIAVRQGANSKPKFTSTEQFVALLAAEAVKDASENNQITLDYSPDSIKQVEEILGKLHDSYVRNPKSISVSGLASAYGAYIGEVIRRSEPNAHWLQDDQMGEKTYPIVWGPSGKRHSYPMGWCARRITDGDVDNVWIKYRMLKDGKVDAFTPKSP